MDQESIKIATEAAKELGVKELAPTLYKDVLQPAAGEVGQQLLLVAKAVRVALSPIEGLVWGYEQTKAFVSAKVAAKLANKPPTEIQSPDKTIAGPLLLNLAFASDAPHLKEMYANLLANAMHTPTASHVHPSFVQVIEQLTPSEAQLLKLISSKVSGPAVLFTERVASLKYGMREDRSTMRVFMDQFVSAAENDKIVKEWKKLCGECGITDEVLVPTFLRNMIRLQILDERLTRVPPDAVQLMLNRSMASDGVLTQELKLTDYGNLFLNLCVRDEPAPGGEEASKTPEPKRKSPGTPLKPEQESAQMKKCI